MSLPTPKEQSPSSEVVEDQELQELIARIVGRDQSALRELVNRTRRTLGKIARGVHPRAADVEEVLVRMYEQVWLEAEQFDRKRGAVLAWLTIMTRSRAIDRLRSERRQRGVPLDPGALSQLPSADRGPLSGAVDGEHRNRIQVALGALPDEQGEAIAAVFFDGLTHKEVAEGTGQPIGTIKSRVRRGLITLRTLLEDQRGEIL